MEQHAEKKHMITPVYVISTVVATSCLIIFLVSVQTYDQRQVPVSPLVACLLVTMYLVLLFRKPYLQEFAGRKLVQAKINLTEKFLAWKTFFLKKTNRSISPTV